jgi:predicted dehydrogenase
MTRVGVIGVGHLGYHHARVYSQLPGVELVGVSDTNEQQLEKVTADFSTEGFLDYEELLDRADAVSVGVPTSLHYAVGKRCLETDVNVLIEKPICADLVAADELVDLADKKQLTLQVGHVERFNGAVRKLAEVIKKPRFVECHRLSPYPSRGDDVGVVLDLMIHDIDIVLSLVRSPVEEVDAVGVPVFSQHEDIANARLRFANGCVANLTASRVSVDKMRKIRIFESDAYISVRYDDQELKLYRKRDDLLAQGLDPMSCIDIEVMPVDKQEPLRAELASFIRCVETGERPVVSGEDGRDALKLAAALTQQIERLPKE